MTFRTKKIAGVVSLLSGVLSLSVGPALGHHSFAMFDFTKKLELSGTVKELEWTNPHSWLHIVVTDEKGQTVEWSFEMGGSGALARKGWKPKIVLPGDKISIVAAPLKNGTPGGALLSMTLSDGRKVGT